MVCKSGNRLLEPWTRGDTVVALGSLCPTDSGFDVRSHHGLSVRLDLKPGAEYRMECDRGAARSKEIRGNAEEICAKLLAHGYQVVAANTPNGREIRAVPGGFEVQPRNYSYWIKVRTLSQALVAFERPELAREGET